MYVCDCVHLYLYARVLKSHSMMSSQRKLREALDFTNRNKWERHADR